MKKKYTLSVLFTSLAVSYNAMSQENVDEKQLNENELEVVVVTATKRPQNLQDVAIAVTGLSASALERGAIDNIAQASKLVPNLKLNHGRDSGSQATIHVRGVGQSDEHGEPGVAMYVDGVYLARSYGSLLDLVDLERIEVLRGPQGTLFGRNTIGGAISLVTRKPNDENEFNLELGYGTFDSTLVKASAQTSIIEDKLFTRASLVSIKDTGHTRNELNGERLNDKSSLAYRLAFRALITDDFEMNIAFDMADDQSNAPAALISAIDPSNGTLQLIESTLGPVSDYIVDGPAGVSVDSSKRRAFLDSSNDNDLESWGLSAISDIRFDNFELKSITAYREIENQIRSDLDGTPFLILDQRSVFSNWQLSQEFQFTGQTNDENTNWLFGLYYFNEHQELPIDVEILPGLASIFGANIGFKRDVARTAKSYAVFGSINHEFNDELTLTIGGRYTREDKTLEALRETFSGDVTFLEPGTEDSFNSFSPKLSLSYKIDEDVMGYASYSKGFKSGGFNSRAASDGQTQSYDPEELNSYEIGVKSRFMDDTVQLNVAAFYSDYTDIQQQIFTTDGTGSLVSTVTNAAEATITGAEIELKATPTDNLVVNASLGLIDAEFDEFNDALLGDLTSRKFQDTPETSYQLGADYYVDLTGEFSLRFTASYSYQSKVYYDPLNSEEIAEDGYGLLNASLSLLSTRDYKVSIYGKNLTDEVYRVSGVNLLGADDFGYGLNYYGDPRTFGVRVKFQF